MIKKITSLIILAAMALSLFSCSFDRETIMGSNAFPSIFGKRGTGDTSDHECVFIGEDGDCIRLVKCYVDGCEKYGRPPSLSIYDKLFEKYLDCGDLKDEATDFCEKILAEFKKTDGYGKDADPEKGEELAKDMEKLRDYKDFVSDMVSVVFLYYSSDIEKYGDMYRDSLDYSDTFLAKFGDVEVAAYDSEFRDYVFPEDDGWDEETLSREIAHARAISDDMTDIIEKIEDVSLRIDSIEDIYSSDEAGKLMSEQIGANNEYARRLGYENYYEYARFNEYGRDYTEEDTELFISFVKEYIAPVMWHYYSLISDQPRRNGAAYSVTDGSFLDDRVACDAIASFLKSVGTAPGADVSYYDSANTAFIKGNMRSSDSDLTFPTAYTDCLRGVGIPIMFFSGDYTGVNTFIHEHGHYYAELTGSGEDVSFDFNETQSQGAELLYTAYLKDYFEQNGYGSYREVMTELIALDLLSMVYSAATEEFEKIVYTGNTEGVYDPEGKLSDGISDDEYDYLYACVLDGYDFAYGDDYWRVSALKNPCYQISYSISLAVALQIFALAEEDGYEEAASAYLASFTSPLEAGFEDRESSDIEYLCERAGLSSPFKEATYVHLSNFLYDVLD